jgi:hypothetical protein
MMGNFMASLMSIDYSYSFCSLSTFPSSPEDFLDSFDPSTHPMYTQHELLSSSWMNTGIMFEKLIRLTKAIIANGIVIFFIKCCCGFYWPEA